MKQTFLILFLILLALPLFAKSAGDFTLDGIRIGDNYEKKILSREPYQMPCDNDPVDNRTRRIMFYAPVECRRTPPFPGDTLVVFYLKYDEKDAPYSQPVEAILWLEGSWFTGKTDFPYQPGITPASLTQLGKPVTVLEYKTKGLIYQAYRFTGDINALVLDGKVIGFILGAMPESVENEQWRMAFKVHRSYYLMRKKRALKDSKKQ